MSQLSDVELMLALRDGDVSRLGVLFERHHLRLFNLLRRLGVPRSAAEDLVQEVFFRMLKYRHNFQDGSDFKPWFYQVARNVAADHFRRRGHELPVGELVAEPADPAPVVTEQMQRAESAGRMRLALQSLAPEKREVLVLSRFQLLKYDQIAGMLGCSVGAVKVRVHRALQELRDAYHGADPAAGGAS